MRARIKSFTLPELLMVMIITAIVVGMAFSVLRLVRKEVHAIRKNFDQTTALNLFEQRLWQDFSHYPKVEYSGKSNRLFMVSEIDTAQYFFQDDFILRNKDTIKLKLSVEKVFFNGKEAQDGPIDAISILAEKELPDYGIFVSRKDDASLFMNQDGI